MRILNLFPANEQAELYNKNSIFKHKLLILLNSFIIKIFNPDFTDSKLYKNLSFYCTTLVYNASFKLNFATAAGFIAPHLLPQRLFEFFSRELLIPKLILF